MAGGGSGSRHSSQVSRRPKTPARRALTSTTTVRSRSIVRGAVPRKMGRSFPLSSAIVVAGSSRRPPSEPSARPGERCTVGGRGAAEGGGMGGTLAMTPTRAGRAGRRGEARRGTRLETLLHAHGPPRPVRAQDPAIFPAGSAHRSSPVARATRRPGRGAVASLGTAPAAEQAPRATGTDARGVVALGRVEIDDGHHVSSNSRRVGRPTGVGVRRGLAPRGGGRPGGDARRRAPAGAARQPGPLALGHPRDLRRSSALARWGGRGRRRSRDAADDGRDAVALGAGERRSVVPVRTGTRRRRRRRRRLGARSAPPPSPPRRRRRQWRRWRGRRRRPPVDGRGPRRCVGGLATSSSPVLLQRPAVGRGGGGRRRRWCGGPRTARHNPADPARAAAVSAAVAGVSCTPAVAVDWPRHRGGRGGIVGSVASVGRRRTETASSSSKGQR